MRSAVSLAAASLSYPSHRRVRLYKCRYRCRRSDVSSSSPPFSVSLPSPPSSVSAPRPPFSVSLPPSPLSVSARSPPVITLFERVAGADERVGVEPGVGQVLHVGDELERERGHLGLDRVGAGTRRLDDHVGRGRRRRRCRCRQGRPSCRHRGRRRARRCRRRPSRRPAGRRRRRRCSSLSPVPPKIRSLPLPPMMLVVDALLADDEVVDRRGREVDAAASRLFGSSRLTR